MPTALQDTVASKPISLAQLRRGQRGQISGCDLADSDASMLRAMGIRPNATLEVRRLGEPCIVCVLGDCGSSCRIAMARGLAERVLVCPTV